MKTMQGALFLPCSNMSRTRDAPTPTNISTKSEPEIVKNGTFASPAMARASRVLPVPGGPTSRQPFGIRPPSRWNFCGSLRNSTISSSSCFASSIPATSAKVTRPVFSVSSRARDLPKPIALPPPACICRMKKIQTPMRSSIGNQEMSTLQIVGAPSSAGCAVMRTLCFCRRSISSPSSGAYVEMLRPSRSTPEMVWPFRVTSRTSPESTCWMKSE